MTHKIDQRGKLRENPFAYQIAKDGRVLIYWNERLIMTVKGQAAGKLLGKLDAANEADTQLILAKATGHFKHGNERRT